MAQTEEEEEIGEIVIGIGGDQGGGIGGGGIGGIGGVQGGGGAPPTPRAAQAPAPVANQGNTFIPGGSRGTQNKIIKSTTQGAGNIQSSDEPEGSGDIFESLSISTNVSYSSFTDDVIGSSGHYDSRSISLSTTFGSDFSLGVEYAEDRYNYGRKASIRKTMLRSTTLYSHYTINDNYGLGAYGYYQTVDIEDQNANTYSFGGGVLFTTYHQLYDFNIQTSTSVSWVDYDISEEAVFYSQLNINKDINDWINVGAYISFADSFAEKEDFGLDRTYWNGGVSANFFIKDFLISVGYIKTFKLSGYTDNTLNVGVTYTF